MLNPKPHFNLTSSELKQKSLDMGEVIPTQFGCPLVLTGEFTGRSPKDRFIVAEPSIINEIDWNSINQPISEYNFWRLFHKVQESLDQTGSITTKVKACGPELYEYPIKFTTEKTWQSLFLKNMFHDIPDSDVHSFQEEFTVYNASSLKIQDYQDYQLNSPNFVIFNIAAKIGIIGGTQYAGEMKKGIFSMLNFFLPKRGVLPMHCGAHVNENNETNLFFGLSGTGKTTLSSDPSSVLIGDDEHAWCMDGIFNIEGGCYAKTANIDPAQEPLIFQAIRDNALLENVVQKNGAIDFKDLSLTPNGRVSYSLDQVHSHWNPKVFAPHPKRIFLLTCDSLGVLPPVSILNFEQACYHFLVGYTSKVSGTEIGVTDPELTFSAGFAAPFLTRSPLEYTRLLYKYIRSHQVECYLINTGWVNGPYGVGHRISIQDSRDIIHYCNNLKTSGSDFTNDHFGLTIPQNLKLSEDNILNPIDTWEDKNQFLENASRLKREYQKVFHQYLGDLEEYQLGFLRIKTNQLT